MEVKVGDVLVRETKRGHLAGPYTVRLVERGMFKIKHDDILISYWLSCDTMRFVNPSRDISVNPFRLYDEETDAPILNAQLEAEEARRAEANRKLQERMAAFGTVTSSLDRIEAPGLYIGVEDFEMDDIGGKVSFRATISDPALLKKAIDDILGPRPIQTGEPSENVEYDDEQRAERSPTITDEGDA